MSLHNATVLVLNKGWFPIHIKSAKEAICDVFAGYASVIDTNDPAKPMYNWDEWAQLAPLDSDDAVQTSKTKIRIPEIIVLKNYNRVPELDIKLTRSNLLLRDNYTCQYCAKKVTKKDFTLDHLIPRSKGGKNSWTNLVIACRPCNVKKRDRTPQEAGFVLIKKPVKPNWMPLATRLTIQTKESWMEFLPKNQIPSLTK